MTPSIIIHKGSDGTTRMVAHVAEGSKRYFMLMEHDYITLKFSSEEAVLLHLGDYVEIENIGRYEIAEPTKGEYNTTTGGYDYEIRLDAQYWKFKNKLFKFLPQIGSNETIWNYTDTLPNHAQQVLFNLRAQAYSRDDDGNEIPIPGRESFKFNNETDWRIEWDDTVDTTKAVTIQYEKLNIIDAIAAIAEAYECEWWFEQEVLHFGKCEFGDTPVRLEMGKELVAISRTDSKETYATRLYIYGSDRNIASNYRKDLIFDATIEGGKLHDSERPIEIGYFRNDLIGTRSAKAATQAVLDFEKISNANLTIEYGTSGQQGAACHLFKPDNHTGNEYNFDLTGERESIKSGMFEWEWLPMEKPYLILSTLKISITPTALNKTTEAIIPTHLQASCRMQVDYYEEDGKTKQTLYRDISAKAVWKGLNQRHTFSFEDTYLPIPTEKVIRIIIENGSQINFAICYDDKTSGNYGYVYDNKPSITATLDAEGQIGVFEGWPEFRTTGVTIEVLDKATGEVAETIEGAIFNESYESDQRKLTLPAGKTIAAGAKYQLPQLNKALVPARFFTSIYSVFEKYQDISTNGIVNSRLLLPEQDENGNPLKGYIDIFDFESEEEAVEDVVIFEDIYPSRVSKITELTRSDEYVDEQQEQDGSTTQKKWKAYRYKDDLFNDSNPFDVDNYAIDGADLQITFQSGLLNGMTFDVLYDTDGRFFEIQRDDTTLLPNETIMPKVGDEFILHGFNIAMLSDSRTDYVSNAEQELLSKGREYAERLNTDTSTYQCTVACDTAYEAEETTPDSLFLEPGRTVNLIHPAYFANGRISRVLGYEIPLDFAYDNPIYTIGEKASYSRIGEIEDKLDGIGNQTGNFAAMLGGGVSGAGATGSGASVQIIGRGDTTVPSDRNVYSSLRARVEFALKTIAQTISHLWTFLKGIRIGTFVSGHSGAEIDAAGNAEVESITVRSWLKVQELIYNRLNALEGDTSFADVGTIEQIADNEDGTQTVYMRMRWEGDFTAFQPGDVVYGYVNDLDRADSKESFKAWAWVRSIDRTANQLVLSTYPDSETPAGKNHPMTAGMTITRWGNNIEPTLQTYINPEYSAVIAKRGDSFINTRQRSFFISCDNGNLIELMGVNKPKLEAANYGTILGIIPDGLLDEKTQELINKDQPYLFARGIIVQDLIRIGYEGVQTRTANYRGLWDYNTAASATDYYRTTPQMYDTVTWRGSLWQCVASNNTDEPSDSNAAWLKMTASPDDGKEVRLWLLNPSASIVSVRRTEVRPEVLTCGVTLCSSNNATQTFDNNYDLLLAGAKLFYSADGLNFEEFIIGQTEPLDLEDDSGVIEMEDSEDNSSVLTVGGNDIPTAEIGDRIIFSLRDADTGEELAQTHVPVVKDGERAPFQSTVFYRTNETPAKPTGGTYESPIPTSAPQWHDAIPEGEEILWATTRTFADGQQTEWEEPRQMTDTATYDVEFSDTDQDPGTPSTRPTLWFDPDKDKATKDFTKMLWRAERQKKNGAWSDWTIVRIKGETGDKGDKGDSGDFVSYVFKQSETKPDTPTDMQHVIPSGWQDAPTAIGRWWMSKAIIDGITEKPKESWSEPVQVTAEDGVDGGYTDFMYKAHITGQSPAVDRTQNKPDGWSDNPPTLHVGYTMWMIQAEKDHNHNLVGQWSTPVRISGEKGDKGEKGDDGEDGQNGTNGIDGRDGLMVYPAGYYDENTTYTATSETAPVVMYAENYYVLRRGCTYRGSTQAENRNTPAKEVANAPTQDGASTSRWQLFDKFNAIFADIIMADFAKLASAVFYGDWMISQQGTLTYTREYRYKTATSASAAGNDLDIRKDSPSGWATTYPTSIPDGSSVYYISALKNPDGTLGDGQEWTSPLVTTAAKQSEQVTTENSTKYQDFKHGGFEPNYSVNLRTGEINAGSGVFSGALLTTFKYLDESDATRDNSYQYTLNKDLKIIASGASTIILPSDPSYIGQRVMVCNNVTHYSRTDQTTQIQTQSGSYILGFNLGESTAPTSGENNRSYVAILTGVIELVGIPKEYARYNDDYTNQCDWMIISLNARYAV